MKEYSIAVSSEIHNTLSGHLIRSDGQEDLCFALWYPSTGHNRTTALIFKVILPKKDDRNVHNNASFNAQYFERAVSEARRLDAGIVFLHSHPSFGWQDMSTDDIYTESSLAASTKGATGLPLIGMTLGLDGAWSGRFWVKKKSRFYERMWCRNVRVVGKYMDTTFSEKIAPIPSFKDELNRTISAWGEVNQAKLSRLVVGVVGCGSVGSMVAESLARMGVQNLKLFDFDTLQVHNLDRTLNARKKEALLNKAKVEVVGKSLLNSATVEGFKVDQVEYSIAEEKGYRKALDCDVLFSCVDRPLGRYVLNCIAFAHLIPVIDGGIKVLADSRGLKHADWRAHIVSPERVCLECLGQFNVAEVQLDRDGHLDDPRYIENNSDLIHRGSENVFAFSLNVSGLEVLRFLNYIFRPSKSQFVGPQIYHFLGGDIEFDTKICATNCHFPAKLARGDRDVTVYGRHITAEIAREKRRVLKSQVKNRIREFIYDVLG